MSRSVAFDSGCIAISPSTDRIPTSAIKEKTSGGIKSIHV